jgi:hypothetical protein
MYGTALQSHWRQGLHAARPFGGAFAEFPPHGYSEAEAWGEECVSVWVARGVSERVSFASCEMEGSVYRGELCKHLGEEETAFCSTFFSFFFL